MLQALCEKNTLTQVISVRWSLLQWRKFAGTDVFGVTRLVAVPRKIWEVAMDARKLTFVRRIEIQIRQLI